MPNIHSVVSRGPLRLAVLIVPLAAIGCGDGGGATIENPKVAEKRASKIEALQKKAGVKGKNSTAETPAP